MSGLVVMWNLDGQPANPRLLERMTETIAHRGPDGDGYWLDQSVALGHRMLHTTPESLREIQPLTDETGHLCLAFDGRLDNREEVAAGLRSKGGGARTDSDAELVLQAYAVWGRDCPLHLLGDFAFVIWDGRNRRLFCARDPLGGRPLYYYRDHRVLLCASELPPFFAHPRIRRECNEGMIGEYLANAITTPDETLFRGIRRLLPAQTLTITAQGLQAGRYWDMASHLDSRSTKDCAEEFRSRLREAVRARLRAHQPVGAELSGGLDSSSVVGTAGRLLQDRGMRLSGFETFSLIFPGLPCDESFYIKAVTDKWGAPSNTLCPEAPEPGGLIREIERHLDFPAYPNHAMSNALYSLASAKGMRVMLTGLGGDDWLGEGFPPYADLLRRGRLLACLQEMRKDSDGALPVIRELLATTLPRSIRQVYRRALRRDPIPAWIDPGFARRVALADRLRRSPEPQRFRTYVQRDLLLGALDAERAHAYDLTERMSSASGLESRHPFNDRRFVEFALGLPDEQRYRDGEVKVVLRHAMHDDLPEQVRSRQTKAEFSAVFNQAFHSLGADRLFTGLAVEGQWIKGEHVRSMFTSMQGCTRQGEPPPGSFLWSLWRILGIDLWYRTVMLKEEWRPEPVLGAPLLGRPMPSM